LSTLPLLTDHPQLHTLVRNLPLAVAFFDREHRFLQLNEKAAQFNEIPVSAHLGRLLHEVLPVNARTVGPLIDRVFRTSEPIGNEEVVGETPLRPGVPRHWLTGYFPVFGGSGDVQAVGVWATEITDLRASEQAVRRRDQQLRLALASSRTGLWSWNIASDAVTWSHESYEIHGMTPGQFGGTGAAFFELVHADGRDRLRAQVEAAVRNHNDYRSEFRVRLPNGAYRWVANRGSASYDAAGHATEVLGTITDIDDRKRAEALLRDSEARFRATFENAAVGMAHVDRNGRWLEVNDRLCAIMGRTREELLATDFQAITHPADLATDLAWSQEVLAGTRRQYSLEKRYLRKDGTEVWANLTVSARHDANGAFAHFISIVEDIGARKASEQALQAALQASQTGIFHWDIQRDSLEWDDDLDRLFGLEPGESVRELPAFVARVHPEDRAGVLERCERCRTEGADFDMEFRVVWPDGTQRWLYDRGRTFRDAAGRPSYMTGACVDITERKRIEQALHEAGRQKDEFLAMLAHELRNPLAPLRSGIELVRRATAPDVRERALDAMSRQLSHMVRLVDDLLDVSRISRGMVELRREPLDLRTAVEHALDAVRPSVQAKRQKLRVMPCDEALPLDGDATRLVQVAGNILVNASKYTPEGGRIDVSLRRDGNEAVFVVRDDGKGIPPAMLDSVFDLFVQVERTVDRAHGGLGIGLALVRRLISLHGGSVRADSEGAGLGSTFTVRLPLQAPAIDAQPLASSQPAVPFRPRRIMVVDDNHDGADNMSELLRLLGHETKFWLDGASALSDVLEFRPEVVLLDIGMPVMSGYEVARRLRSRPDGQSMMLVALTGWGSESDRREAMDAGFDAHLTKPVDIAERGALLAGPDRSTLA
jgi:two-component system CheB/CheR fusion protein